MENKKRGFQFPDKFQDIDPVTGKIFLVPLNFGTKTRSRSPKTKLFSPLKPLDFEAIKRDLKEDSIENPKKIRKIDEAPHSARRLFQSKPQTSRPTLSRQSTFRKIAVPQRKMSISNSKSSSPLLNMEEVEQQLLKKKSISNGYQFTSPILPKAEVQMRNTTDKLKIPQIILEEVNDHDVIKSEIEPTTPDSSHEFQKLEQICKDSPVTSMCNLMQDTAIQSGKKRKPKSDNIIDTSIIVEEMLIEEVNRHKRTISKLQQLIVEQESNHQQNMSKLNSLLLVIRKSDNVENKENETNKNRRSERLQNKSPTGTKKLITSPSFLKRDDLRKSTLKKNLVATKQDFPHSPRAQRAMLLYNSLKTNNSVLETPRSDRKTSNNLSSRIQNQCLLLQDTPVHKLH